MLNSLLNLTQSIVQGYGVGVDSFATWLVGNDPLGKSLVKIAILGSLVTSLVLFRKVGFRFIKNLFSTTIIYRCVDSSADEIVAFEQTLEYIFLQKKNRKTLEVRRHFDRSIEGVLKEKRNLVLSLGNSVFIHQGRPIFVSYEEEYKDKILVRYLCIVGLFMGKQTILELIPPFKNKTERVIYRLSNSGLEEWSLKSMIAVSTEITNKEYFVPQKIKKDLDIALDKYLLNTEMKASKGITNKLNILLYGPPGTGKTTFGFYIAKYLQKNILTIEGRSALSDSPAAAHKTNSIVFLDEVDGIFKNTASSTSEKEVIENEIIDKDSLSILQMVLQGTYTLDNQVVIMTTNHPERLGEACKRVGRIDLLLEIGHYDKDDLCEWIEWFYGEKYRHINLDHLPKNYRFRACDLAAYYDENPNDLQAFIERLPEAHVEYVKHFKLEENNSQINLLS